MKTFNEIMKIRDEPDNKPEVTKRQFQVKKTNNEKMQAFGWASVVCIAGNQYREIAGGAPQVHDEGLRKSDGGFHWRRAGSGTAPDLRRCL